MAHPVLSIQRFLCSTSWVGPGATNLLTSRAGNWHVWQTSLHNPSFSEYAKLCGAQGILVTAKDQLDDVIAEALAHDGPSLVEVMADPELI